MQSQRFMKYIFFIEMIDHRSKFIKEILTLLILFVVAKEPIYIKSAKIVDLKKYEMIIINYFPIENDLLHIHF